MKKLHTNQQLIVDLLISKGAELELIDSFDEIIAVKYKDKKEFLVDRFTSIVPFNIIKITADKFLTKKILNSNNLSTPEGNVFYYDKYQECFNFSERMYPVVLKPNWGSHGDSVYSNIKNSEELKLAIFKFISKNNKETAFIIEKYFPWKEYRLFITKNDSFAVIHRDNSYVIGNGFDTIKELISKENELRARTKKEINSSLCPIVLDDETNSFLNDNQLSLNEIPKKDEKIYLRYQSNLAKGGVSVDYTDLIDSRFKNLAKKVLSSFPGMPIAGIDVLIKNPSNFDDGYVVLEVNSNPGLSMHYYPHVGKRQPVDKYVLDVMFPKWFD